jgi:hypothetical protein
MQRDAPLVSCQSKRTLRTAANRSELKSKMNKSKRCPANKWCEEEESFFGEKCARSERKDRSVVLDLNSSNRRKRFLKTLAVVILVAEIVANLLDSNNNNNTSSSDSDNSQERNSVDGKRSSSLLTGSLLPVIVFVAANGDAYTDVSPAVDALEDDDEDDEELNASASNEYPDGENDNDESYEDGDG